MTFPKNRPERACYPRPRQEETVDVTPPGFCWWRVAERDKVRYRLKVMHDCGSIAYESPMLDDPVHVPTQTLAPGRYTWVVEAFDAQGQRIDTREPWTFSVVENPVEQPWVSADELIARVPAEHPRVLFPSATLDEVRDSLGTTRRAAFESLKRQADRSLKLKIPREPDYDKIEDAAERRLAYVSSFRKMRHYHTGGMLHLALMYLMTGERNYGEKAKALLTSAAEWDPEGISSVLAPHGDEIGLGLAKSATQTYDWIYDLLTQEERALVEKMLVARADQMLRRLTKHDFLAYPENSHDGRLPGYLVEHAIALAEQPRARGWMDYALRTLMTVFPHWAGKNGGWAEGVPYGLAYNTIYLMPFESLRRATGLDLWQREFYRKVRRFFMYNISPRGEIMPWGDTEHAPVPPRAGNIAVLLMFHALRYRDPELRWWVELLKTADGEAPPMSPLPGLILADNVEPRIPEALPADAAFFGVGWAVLHSDLTKPDDDLMVMFKSSPYGAVSHSHADQNSFAIMKGGRALAIPAGERYPHHGTPFHTEYTQQTIAHNAVLVNGQGQINRKASANGHLVDFQTNPCFGYVCGDAKAAYGTLLNRCRRHVLLVRPSLVVMVDDLEATEPVSFQWLMHAREELDLDEPGQTLISHRAPFAMQVHLVTPDGFDFEQTDAWPLDPKTGFPTTKKKPPAKQWHFTATTRERSTKRRIVAIIVVGKERDVWRGQVQCPLPTTVEVRTKVADGAAVGRINLGVDRVGAEPILELEVESRVEGGKQKRLSVK